MLSQLSYTPVYGYFAQICVHNGFSFRPPRTLVRKVGKKFVRCVKLREMVGLSGLEPPTSRLSGVRSNRLSYRPMQGIGVKVSLSLFYQYFVVNVHAAMYIQR